VITPDSGAFARRQRPLRGSAGGGSVAVRLLVTLTPDPAVAGGVRLEARLLPGGPDGS
jgi:hypothetical protein